MAALLDTLKPFGAAFAVYITLAATLGINRPRTGIRIAGMLNRVLLPVLLFLGGATVALTWARNFISDPANHGAFWGPSIGTEADDGAGDRQIIFAHNALAGELDFVITAGLCFGLCLVINLAVAALCDTVLKEDTDSGQQEPDSSGHTYPYAQQGNETVVPLRPCLYQVGFIGGHRVLPRRASRRPA